MPYVVTCPKCPAKLKSAQPVPAGRTITCPQCKTAFTLSEPAKLVADANATVPVRPPLPPTPAAPPKPAPATKKSEAPGIIDGADFEFTAKPKPKKADLKDEPEERPKAKKKREEVEEESREPEDDFDDDLADEPRAPSGNSRLLLLGLIGIAAGFALFCVLMLVLNLAGVFTLFA